MKKFVHSILIAGIATTAAWGAPGQDRNATQAAIDAKADATAAAATVTKIDYCDSNVPVIPRERVKNFARGRIARTLHGVWMGRVRGEYPAELNTEEGMLNVDYYMIIDTDREEAMVLEQFTTERTVKLPLGAEGTAPAWSFLMCGKEQYVPEHPRQVHEFFKVSDSLEDAAAIVAQSSGVKMSANQEFVVSDAWSKLTQAKYFDDQKYLAYAGALFKPFRVRSGRDADGTPVVDIQYTSEMRGSGATAAEFEPGEARRGDERGQFIGVTTERGDFLVASFGNGIEWFKESIEEIGEMAPIDVGFEHVVIGPIEP